MDLYNTNKLIFFFKLFVFLNIIKPYLFEFSHDTPIKNQGSDECKEIQSTKQEFQGGICTIENEIRKSQIFTSIIQFSGENYDYALITTTPNGDLLASSSKNCNYLKYFYGLKNNGRPFFYDNGTETPLKLIDTYSFRHEGNLFGVKFDVENDDKEYIISIGNDISAFEIYDFENNITKTENLGILFPIGVLIFYKGTILKLNSTNNIYIIGFIDYNGEYHFVLSKLRFTSIEINEYSPIESSLSYLSSSCKIVSCFETISNDIICFFLDANKHYTMIVLDQNLNGKKNETLYDQPPTDTEIFYKCVHFKDISGAFLYYESNNDIKVQFKQYNSTTEEISNYFNSVENLTIHYFGQHTNVKSNDMIKLEDSKFCFIAINSNHNYDDQLFIVIVNNYLDEYIKISYYAYANVLFSNYFFGDELSISLYNGLIAMVSSNHLGSSEENQYISLIIFSYPNSTDFDLDITENLKLSRNVNINLKERVKIENNLFGYILYGIKIIDFTDGFIVKSTLREIQINKGEILINEELITLVLSKNKNIPIPGKIEYAMIATESDYNEFEDYICIVDRDYCGGLTECIGEENVFQKKLYEGRHSYCNIVVDHNFSNESFVQTTYLFPEKNNDEIPSTLIQTNTPTTHIETTIIHHHHHLHDEITTLSNPIETTIFNHEDITTEPNLSSHLISPIETTIINQEITSTELTLSTFVNSPIISTFSDKFNEINDTILPIETTLIDGMTKPFESSINTEGIISNLITYNSNDIGSDKLIYTNKELIPTSEFEDYTKIDSSHYNQINENLSEENIPIKTIIIPNESNNVEKNLCSNEDIIKNLCDKEEITFNKIEDIKKILFDKNYTTDENIIIKTKNAIIQLSGLDEQKNSNNTEVSNIDLGECEDRLRRANNISENEQLILYKVDIKIGNLSATYVQYEIYEPKDFKSLNLSICNDLQITINVPVNMDSNIENLYNSLSESGYNLFDENDAFYNDICATYTTLNGTDMLLSDRKKDIFNSSQSQYMCQTGCELESYNSTNKKAKCDCSVTKESFESNDELDIKQFFNKKEIGNNFYKTLANSNFRVLKCYPLVFEFRKILKNYGEIFLTIIFLGYFISSIVCFIQGRKLIQNYISLIINKIFVKKDNITNKKQNNINENKDNQVKTIIRKRKKASKTLINKKSKFGLKKRKKKKTKTDIIKIKNQEPPKKSKKNSKNYLNESASNTKKSLLRLLEKKCIKNNILINVQLKHPGENNNNNNNNNIFYPNKLGKKNNKRANINKFLQNEDSKLNSKHQLNLEPNLKNSGERNNIMNYINTENSGSLNDYELNSLSYNLAVKYDKRTYFQYYCSLLKQKQLILFTFILSNDYNILSIKISLILISFCLYFTINGFFFNDETMHKTYEENGKYDFIFKIPQILYSTIISAVINFLLKTLALSGNNIIKLKGEKDINEANRKSIKLMCILKIKFLSFFFISFILMAFFWYFISCFCAVFINTQIILIKDSLISFILSMLYPFGLNLLPGIFRIPALRSKNNICLFKFSKIIAII